MSRFRDALVVIVVACVVSGSSLVLGQAQKAAVKAEGEAKQKEARKAEAKDVVARRQAVRRAMVLKQAVAVQAAPAAVLDAQAAQYVEQFRPMFKSEYYFISNACNLTKDQRKQLARLGESAVKGAARQFVEAQQKMMRGGWRPGMEYPDPRRLIEDELAKNSTGLLSPGQLEQYKQELAKRTASRKQVFVDNLIVRLDRDLVLTSQQRSRLADALLANWKDSWGQSLDMLQDLNNNVFPNIPDQVVAPVLTDLQKEVWRRIPKNTGGFYGFSVNGMVMDPDPLDDPELAEVRKEAQAKEKP